MSSPIPVDPYLALGVARDADIGAIRSAHRKLVLKFHPDRVKDEAERPRAKDEFQKVQQAYELLSDPAKRERYDSKVKLAELRKEAMFKDPIPVRTSTYPAPRGPPASPYREYRDDRIYEERVPRGAYFDDADRFRDDVNRTSSRKADDYGQKSPAPQYERERERERDKKSSRWEAKEGMSFDAAFKLKKAAARAKESVAREKEKEKEREREKYAASAKSRDRDRRRDSSDKHKSRRAYVEDESSSSDSDTATQYSNRPPLRASKTSYTTSPRARSKTEPTKKPESRSSRHDEDQDDEWERRHDDAQGYIQKSQKRPGLNRSDTQSYWHGQGDGSSGRRSGSDSDRRKHSSTSPIPNPKIHTKPPMPTYNSSPAGLKVYPDEREPIIPPIPQVRRSATHMARDATRPVPSMPRHNTMPSFSPTSRRAENPAARGGSKLRHAETPHDSGYSSTSPHLPDLREPSPQRHSSSKTYPIVDPDDEYSRPPRSFFVDEEDRQRSSRSPSPRPRDRNRDRDRDRDRERRHEKPQKPTITTDGLFSRSPRGATYNGPSHSPVESPRAPLSRHESMRHGGRTSSSRDAPPLVRESSVRGPKLPYEISPEDREPTARYTYTYPAEKVSASPRYSPDDIKFSHRPSIDHRESDYYPNSNHRENLRNVGGRRPSLY